MTPADLILGIDLGTTNTLVAFVGKSGEPTVLPNREGENMTPSAVLIDAGQFVVGRDALSQALARPRDVARWVKRRLGDPDFLFQGKHAPEELQAEILRKVAADASAFLKIDVRRVVITVPAYFVAAQRELTRKAGELAGLSVVELRDEPVAAAVHFGLRGLKAGESVLVCDLGGGTYDATVLTRQDDELRTLAASGSRELGGVDWTARMEQLIGEKVQAETGHDPAADPADAERLTHAAERAKCDLADAPDATIRWSHAGGTVAVAVTRDEFAERCGDLIDVVRQKTVEAVMKSGLEMTDLTHVLLVGGSSRLDMFVKGVAALTGKTPRRSRNPDEAVALGAAIIAAGHAAGGGYDGGVVVDAGGVSLAIPTTASHALGTRVANAKLEIVSDTLIAENAALPAVAEKEYKLPPNQDTFQVPVVELDQFNVIQSLHRNYRFFGVPKRVAESRIRVRFAVDAETKTPDVTATDLLTGTALDRELMPFSDPVVQHGDGAGQPTTIVLAVDCSGSMSGSKIDEARKAVKQVAAKYLAGGSGHSLAVVNFGGDYAIYPATVLVPPTQSLADVDAAIGRMVTGGGTPMDAGFQRIREILELAPPGKRVAVVLTDGQPDNPTAAAGLARTLRAQNIVIGTVPIGTDANREFLKDIGDLESALTVDSRGGGMAACVLDILTLA